MKRLLISTLFVLSVTIGCFAQRNKVILAIFAHPDDEQSVSPVLAKYAASGVTVYVAVATDGRYGFAAHFHVKDPDSLAAIRAHELKCAASMMGIKEPIMLGLHDQLRMKEGMDTLGVQFAAMRNKINSLFNDLKPDVIITWGPSGLTGHPDHRTVSNIVTEVYATKRWKKPANLFYTELATGSISGNRFQLATVDSSYLNVRIPVTKANVDKARAAWHCHKSQYTPAFMNELEQLFWTSQQGTAFFRSYRFNDKIQNSFFAKGE
jgi:LmbE family N-acetylglucosaminyl deacetylase